MGFNSGFKVLSSDTFQKHRVATAALHHCYWYWSLYMFVWRQVASYKR